MLGDTKTASAQSIEGLSVVAISYYAVGLLGYALYPLAKVIHMDKALLTAILTPVAVISVWLGMRRIRARLHDGTHEHH